MGQKLSRVKAKSTVSIHLRSTQRDRTLALGSISLLTEVSALLSRYLRLDNGTALDDHIDRAQIANVLEGIVPQYY